jgi:hypothetical protein
VTITNGYATQQEAKAWLNVQDASLDDLIVDSLVNAASRAVDGYCGRYFYADSAATARVYVADNYYCVTIDDLWDTATAVVKTDSGQDGTFETTLTVSTQYMFEPINGVVGGISGWPATRVRLVGGTLFTSATYGRPQLQVTAKWGWVAVPAPVKQATLQVVGELWKRKDAPFGIIEGSEFGPIRLSADAMRSVTSLLTPYCEVVTGTSVGALA